MSDYVSSARAIYRDKLLEGHRAGNMIRAMALEGMLPAPLAAIVVGYVNIDPSILEVFFRDDIYMTASFTDSVATWSVVIEPNYGETAETSYDPCPITVRYSPITNERYRFDDFSGLHVYLMIVGEDIPSNPDTTFEEEIGFTFDLDQNIHEEQISEANAARAKVLFNGLWAQIIAAAQTIADEADEN
jgi:hypothetical protein